MQGPSSDLVERRFNALLVASASIVWWTNAAGEFVEEQPYWQLYTGQKWDEYRGSRWNSAVHPMPMAIQKAKTADRERELERIVDDWLDKTRDEREEKLAEETTEEEKNERINHR